MNSNSLTNKIQYVSDKLSTELPAKDAAMFKKWMNLYSKELANGNANLPEPNTGNVELNALIIIIINSIEEEDKAIKVGGKVGHYGRNYWYQPYWWNYYYNYWYPYYYWNWNPYIGKSSGKMNPKLIRQ